VGKGSYRSSSAGYAGKDEGKHFQLGDRIGSPQHDWKWGFEEMRLSKPNNIKHNKTIT
jgi:hypothetical protein